MPVTILPFIQQFLNRYIMSISFAMGLIACSIYFFSLSLFANLYLLRSVPLIFYTLDHIDPQTKSLAYCKMRIYLSHVFGLYTRYLIVLACIDLFLITRSSVRVRSWSSPKIAFILTVVMFIVCPAVSSHFPIYMDLRGTTCGLFEFYKFFFGIYQLILVSILPSVVMGIFGFLAVYTVHQREIIVGNVRRRDRDLMRMLVAEILINILASIPFSANLIYTAVTVSVVNKTTERIEIDGFLNFIGQFINQGIFIAPFYLFIISSKSFRRDFNQIVQTCWSKCIRRQNRVTEIHTHVHTVSKHRENIQREHENTRPKSTV